MAQISVSELTFCYEGSFKDVFTDVSFTIDTDWKLGLIGRNGKGKTTFLNLLLGKYEYRGEIQTTASFDYFPYTVPDSHMEQDTMAVLEYLKPDCELWKVCREMNQLALDTELLYRCYGTLSHGERTKVMLALLFSEEENFLLIDEPTNHLDMDARRVVRDYLRKKKGFILVSHDRMLLDACVDHILALNREDITVEKGNFSSWWENKEKKDRFLEGENEKLEREIGKLKASARRTEAWADKVEGSKIGFDPVKEHDRSIATRSYLGEKSKRMQQRRKNLERRQKNNIEMKEGLLNNIEKTVELKLMPVSHHKEVYVKMEEVELIYPESSTPVLSGFSMELKRGERILLKGKNGSGKSSLIKSVLENSGAVVLNHVNLKQGKDTPLVSGMLYVANGLIISYVNQDTSILRGDLRGYIEQLGVEESLFKTLLRQLDFEREQFVKPMEQYSEGQKKKVLIAGSLLSMAHLYIWDEPLNYIDVFSRIQIENLIQKYSPTMLLVEHDEMFGKNVMTREIIL